MPYEFVISNDTNDSTRSPVAGEGGENPKNGNGLTKAQKAVGLGLVALNKAKPWINQVISHELNLVDLRTGRREYAQRIQFNYQVANQLFGVAESALTGYAVGNIPGAVIGMAVSTAHTVINYAQKQDTINTEQALENISLSQNRIRAGVGGSRKV